MESFQSKKRTRNARFTLNILDFCFKRSFITSTSTLRNVVHQSKTAAHFLDFLLPVSQLAPLLTSHYPLTLFRHQEQSTFFRNTLTTLKQNSERFCSCWSRELSLSGKGLWPEKHWAKQSIKKREPIIFFIAKQHKLVEKHNNETNTQFRGKRETGVLKNYMLIIEILRAKQ